MADGDKVHEDLDPRWQDPYKQVWEWGLDEAAIAETIAERWKKDLIMYGEGPRQLIHDYADLLEAFIDGPIPTSPAHFIEIVTRAEDLAQSARGQSVPKDAALCAFEQQLQSIRWGLFSGNKEELRLSLCEKYADNILSSNFTDRLPFNSNEEYQSVSSQTLTERLNVLRPYLSKERSSLARQLAQRDNPVRRLHKAPQQRNQVLDGSFKFKIPVKVHA